MSNTFRRLASIGGGFVSYSVGALQTTLLSVIVAKLESKDTLAVFAFLLSMFYFSSQLLRQSLVEPSLSNVFLSKETKVKKLITLIFLTALVYFSTSLISHNFKIPLALFIANITFFLWTLNKTELRKKNLFLIITLQEFVLLFIILCFLLVTFFNFKIDSIIVILAYAITQLIFLTYNCFFLKVAQYDEVALKDAESFKLETNTHLFGEYVFVLGLVLSNLFLLRIGAGSSLGEVRGVFLLLLASTFSVGAIRNTLFASNEKKLVLILLLAISVANVIIIFLLPFEILEMYIPSLPYDIHSVLIPVTLDLFGSLIFTFVYVRCVYRGEFFLISLSRIVSFLVLICTLLSTTQESYTAITIAWIYCSSSLIGGIFLLFSMLFLSKTKRSFSRSG